MKIYIHAPAFLFQHFLGQGNAPLPLLGSDPMPDPGSGLGGLHKLEPVPAGVAVNIGDDFYCVSVFQGRIQGNQLAVDLGPGAMTAHLGMDQIGEINWSGP